MSGSSYILVCFFTKEVARMIVVAELIAFAVVYEKDAYVVSYVTISNDIHIIEERQITEYAEKQSVRSCESCSYHSRDSSIDTKSANVAFGLYSIRQLKEVP